jgi:hypothetical protein
MINTTFCCVLQCCCVTVLQCYSNIVLVLQFYSVIALVLRFYSVSVTVLKC